MSMIKFEKKDVAITSNLKYVIPVILKLVLFPLPMPGDFRITSNLLARWRELFTKEFYE